MKMTIHILDTRRGINPNQKVSMGLLNQDLTML